MSYEPRSRGMRSRRTTTKKPASKEKRTESEYEFSYKESVPVNPQEVSSRAMNALAHLGNQRFGMPPYSEHFRRWILDVEAVLSDFKTSLPNAVSNGFDNSATQLISNIRTELGARISAEEQLSAKVTDLQGQFAENEREIAELESEQRTKMHEAKRDADKSMTKLRGEINALDAERLKLLRQKPTFLERIFGSAKVRVENSSRSLNSKRTDLESRQMGAKQRMSKLKAIYEEKRKPLDARQVELREELVKVRSTALDDAVEIRKTVCEQLRQIVSTAVGQLTSQPSQEGEQ